MSLLELLYFVSLAGAVAGCVILRRWWVKCGTSNPDQVSPQEALFFLVYVFTPGLNTVAALMALDGFLRHGDLS